MSSNITHEEGNFTSQDGLSIYWQSWRPDDYKAVIMLLHGLAEHSGRYAHVAEHLNQHGYAVYALDHRGHGRSDGMRIYLERFEYLLQDVDQFMAHIRQQEPDKPIFILGHSMGTAVTLMFAITRKPDVKGIILSGSAVKPGDDLTPAIITIGKLLGSILPKLRLLKLDSCSVSRDPEVVRRYDEDPLNCREAIPARTGSELLNATKQIQAQMHTLTQPMLIMHGTADTLANVEGSKMLYAAIKSTDKTLKLYEGLYHEIMNEPEKAEVLAEITTWLDAHM